MRTKIVLMMLGFIVPMACQPLTGQEQVKRVWLLDVEKIYGSDSHWAVAVIQGLANRQGPRVFLNTGNKHWVARFHDKYTEIPEEVLANNRGSDDVWMDYYARRHGFQFESIESVAALARRLGDVIAGVVRYDPRGEGEALVAWTLAGIDDSVPVTDAMLEKSDFWNTLPVLHDLRGRFSDLLQAQQWAFENLVEHCTSRAAFSLPKVSDVDLGIAEKTFFFNLNYMKVVQPREVELLDKILDHLEPLSPVYGWGTSERSMLNRMGQFGVFLQCTDSPNLSFHKAVRPIDTEFRQRRRLKPAEATLEKKYYVTMVGNEGDTLKQIASLQRGAWLNPQRGRIPFNWGMCPWINDTFPAMIEYYYDSMTEYDSFCSVIGYGFYSPKYQVELDQLCEAERISNNRFDIRTGSMYSSHACVPATNSIWDALTDRWVVNRGCDGYVFECSQGATLQFSSVNQPIIGMDWKFFYWWYRFQPTGQHKSLPAMAQYIQEVAAQHEPPFFLPIYGGTPELLYKFAQLLPEDKFKVVALDEMIAAARLAGRVHLTKDILTLEGERSGVVKLTVRHMGFQDKYDGVITVNAPAEWRVTPSRWDYPPIAVNGKQETLFEIHAPDQAVLGEYKIVFYDSRTEYEDILRVNLRPERELIPRQSQAARKVAKRKTIRIDGDTSDWQSCGSDRVLLDMTTSQDSKKTNLKVAFQFAWDSEYLYLLAQEKPGDDRAYESAMGQEFESSEFLIADGIALWFDFDGDGPSENGDFTPYLGFSSTGRTDLYCCTLNDQVLVSTFPEMKVATGGKLGGRAIEAAVAWRDLDFILKDRFKPASGLVNAVAPGFVFGCEPYVTDGEINKDKTHSFGMYLNGAMSDRPNGFNQHSIDIKLSN